MPTGTIGRLVLDKSMKRRIPKHQRMRSISILTWFLQTDSFLDLSVYILVRTIYAYRSIFCLRITLYRRLIHGQHYVSNMSHLVIVSFACDSFVCNYIEAEKLISFSIRKAIDRFPLWQRGLDSHFGSCSQLYSKYCANNSFDQLWLLEYTTMHDCIRDAL
jgi:hypothetical protein